MIELLINNFELL